MPTSPLILVHGLWRSPRSMRMLALAAEQAGFAPYCWGYASRRYRLNMLGQQLRDELQTHAQQQPVNFIGHSLGGLVIRAALQAPLPVSLGRIVLLGTPNQGSGLVRRFYQHGRWLAQSHLYGRVLLDMAAGDPRLTALGCPPCELGVIAGNRPSLWTPNGWLHYLLGTQRDTDGTVEIANARLPGMRDFYSVPVGHSRLPVAPEVIRQSLYFLQHGQFEHGDAEKRISPPAE